MSNSPENDSVLRDEKASVLVTLFNQVFEKGIVKFLIFYPIALTGWIGSVLAILGWTVVSYVVIIAAGLYVVVIVIWLTIALKIQQKALARAWGKNRALDDDRHRLGGQLASHMRKSPDYYTLKSWHEFIHIRDGGDTQIVRTVELIPGDGGIDMAFHSLSANVAGEEADVTFAAFRIIRGDDGAQRKIELDSFNYWERGVAFTNFVVLDEHFSKAVPVHLQMEWEWKRYSTGLVVAGKEAHSIRMSRTCELYELDLKVDRVGAVRTGDLYMDPTTSDSRSVPGEISRESTETDHRLKCIARNLTAGDVVGIRVRNS